MPVSQASHASQRSLRHALFAVWVVPAALLFVGCSDDDDTTPGPQAPFVPPGLGTGGTAALCAAGQTDCLGVCADLLTDARNCGRCGAACGGGACLNGQCACPSTLTACGNGGIDTTSDLANCGSCGRACSAGDAC